MEKKSGGPGLTLEDFLIAFSIALGAGLLGFAIIAVIGYTIMERQSPIDRQPAVSEPTRSVSSASSSSSPRTSAPKSEPELAAEPGPRNNAPEAEPEQDAVPGNPKEPEAQEAAQNEKPAEQDTARQEEPAPKKNAAEKQVAPTDPQAATQAPSAAPAQSAGGTVSNADGTYTHDFSDGRVLATTQSNNNGDPVYHIKNCQAAKKISPETARWYDSAQAAINDDRRLCGYCGK